jgi:hypothetical protein
MHNACQTWPEQLIYNLHPPKLNLLSDWDSRYMLPCLGTTRIFFLFLFLLGFELGASHLVGRLCSTHASSLLVGGCIEV